MLYDNKVDHFDEDSSYDSDEAQFSTPHVNVSRNVSETLAQELVDDYNISVSIYNFFFFFQFRHQQPDLKC